MPSTATSTASGQAPDRQPAVRRWELARLALGTVYVLGAAAHLYLGLRAPEIYTAFADQALLGAYTAAWTSFVVPALPVLQPLVTLFELALGVALLWRGRAVRLGHLAGGGFQAAVVLSGPWGPVNAGLAVVHVVAARYEYPRSAVDTLWRRRAE